MQKLLCRVCCSLPMVRIRARSAFDSIQAAHCDDSGENGGGRGVQGLPSEPFGSVCVCVCVCF